MFLLDPETKKITMHRGDTGEATYRATGRTYGPNDRALYTINSPSGSLVYRKYYPLTDNAFTVVFTNPMTDYLTPGQYKYDVRYIANPVWEGSGDNAQIVDGDEVKTPGSPFILEILNTEGQI